MPKIAHPLLEGETVSVSVKVRRADVCLDNNRVLIGGIERQRDGKWLASDHEGHGRQEFPSQAAAVRAVVGYYLVPQPSLFGESS